MNHSVVVILAFVLVAAAPRCALYINDFRLRGSCAQFLLGFNGETVAD